MTFAEALQSVVASGDHVSGMELVLECVERAGEPEVVAGVREALGRAFAAADEETGVFLVQAVLEHLLEDGRYWEAFAPWSRDPVLGSFFREAVEFADRGARLRRAATRVAERATDLWRQEHGVTARIVASPIGTGSCELELAAPGAGLPIHLWVSVTEELSESLEAEPCAPEVLERAARAALDRSRWQAIDPTDAFEVEVGASYADRRLEKIGWRLIGETCFSTSARLRCSMSCSNVPAEGGGLTS